MKDKTTHIIFLTLLVFVAVFSRLWSLAPNFTAIAAVALFAGAHFRSKLLAFVIPLLAMLLSDLLLIMNENNQIKGFHNTMIPVYAAFALSVGIGLLISNKRKPHYIAAGSVSASVLFFLITNFAVWMTGMMYPMDLSGLLMCYASAVPFFQNTLAGDLFFTALLFGGYYLAQLRFPKLLKVKNK